MPHTDRHDLQDRFGPEQIRRLTTTLERFRDLPHAIGDLAALGVDRFHMHVSDGSTRFHGDRFYQAYGAALYARMDVSDVTDPELLERAYRLFQSEVTDLRTFLGHSADAGVEMLVVHVRERAVTFLDPQGRVLGVHPIGIPAERMN
ncbi:MAG: DUF1398 family protein [Flavobacteriales bacterium]|nr:DUF1398 family protein [Flavobacteriales bacterium]MCB9166253.1 DUF1398 family protein [Flavobacteriales bacterium]